MQLSEQQNAIRWDPEARGGHVESLFIKANDPNSPRALWLRYTILCKVGSPPKCQVWAIGFRDHDAVAAKATYPIEQARHKSHPFSVRTQSFELDEQGARGEIHGAGHSFRFELSHAGHSTPLRLLPFQWMYKASFPRFKLLTPFPAELFSGWFEVDGERWEVKDWPGMQGHNWGSSHAERYAWSHCSSFEGAPDTYFEGFSARVPFGASVTPFLTVLALHHEGTLYRTSLRSMLSAVEVEHTHWRFEGAGRGFKISGEVDATVDRMVGLVYENPTGEPSNCLNSKLARCVLRLERRGQPLVELFSEHGAALEVLVRENPNPIQLVL